MIALLRRIFNSQNEIERQYITLADDPNFWTSDDAIWLKTTFNHISGLKLKARLNNIVFRGALQACAVETNGDYHRGIARGLLLTVQELERLLPPAPAQEGNSEDVAEQEQAPDFALN